MTSQLEQTRHPDDMRIQVFYITVKVMTQLNLYSQVKLSNNLKGPYRIKICIRGDFVYIHVCMKLKEWF